MGAAGTGYPAGARLISVPDLTGLVGALLALLFLLFAVSLQGVGVCRADAVQLPLTSGPGRSLMRAPYTDLRVTTSWTADGDYRVYRLWVIRHRYDPGHLPPWWDEPHIYEANELPRALDDIPAGEPLNLYVDSRLPVGAALRVLEGLGARGHRRVFLVTNKRDPGPP